MKAADIAPTFRYNPKDARLIRELLTLEATPQAIIRFAEVCNDLTDYAYLYILSTLCVSYSGQSDLNLWKRLFSSRRPNRELSLMKPSELLIYRGMANKLTIYRAHWPGETDWIAYTVSAGISARFARERGVDSVTEYRVRKRDVHALFLRRGEYEVLVLDKTRAKKLAEIPVVVTDDPERTIKELQEGSTA